MFGLSQQERYHKKLVKAQVVHHNAVANAENWELQHGSYDYHTNPDNTQVYRTRRGAATDWQHAARLTKGYAAKRPTPFTLSVVQRYSKVNPHRSELKNAAAMHHAMLHSGAGHH